MRERAAGIRILLAGLTPELYSTLRSVAHQLEDIQWVARVQNLGEALDVCRVGTIDVLLVEVPLHEDDHRNFARVVSGLSHRPTIVALSRVRNEESLYEAVSIGAAAVSTFDTSPEFIVSTIRRVFNGERPIEYTMVTNADLARQALRYIRELGPTSDGETLHTPCPLTQRQLGILSSVAQGYSNKEIADQVGIREQTVKNYISTMLRRIGASDRAHAVMLALRNQWITLD